jgi:hypothetical protein
MLRSRAQIVSVVVQLLLVLSPSLRAQSVAPFEHGIVAGSDWLQANALPLNRDAVHSGGIDISLRRQTWSVGVAWLRIARDLSTVQGGAVSVGRLFHWQRVLFIPALSALGGQAQESRDSTGYDWNDGTCTTTACTAGTLTGHQPRYSYSSAATFGGGASLTIEVPVYRAIGVRAVAQQWYFSGAPLDGDRSRTLLGAGVSLRVGR